MSFSEFNTAVLGDLVTIKGGKRLPKGARLISEKNSHPYIKVKDMNGGKKVRLSKTFEYVDDVTQKSIKNYIVNKNDIIISIVGTIGLVSVIDDSLDNANLTENCVKLINLTNVDKDYLYYFLTSDTGQNEMRKGTVGSTQPKLPIYNIKKIELPLPQLDIQKAIAHILSTLDDKIEVNNQINKTLENMAQAIFKQWFVDFEFPNEDGEPYKSSGGEMIESELGMIPKGWEVGTLNDISSEIITGKTPSTKDSSNFNGNIPFVKIPDMHGKVYVTKTETYLSENGAIKNKMIPPNSIIVSCIATPGLVCLASETCQTNQQINTIINKDKKMYYYTYFLLNSLSEHIRTLGSTGSTTLNLNKGQFSKIKVVIPDIVYSNKYFDIVDPLFQEILTNMTMSEELANTRDTLLPKLMSGEIRVPMEEEGEAS